MHRTSELLFKEICTSAGIGYFITLRGNRPVENYYTRAREKYTSFPHFRDLDDLDVRTILITLSKNRSKKIPVRRGTDHDIPALASFLNKDFSGRLFGPEITEDIFRKNLQRRPDLGISDYYIAERNGEIIGTCAALDTRSFKQTKVLTYRTGMRFVKFFYGSAGRLVGFPPLPVRGQSFREVHITDYTVRDRDPEVMEALLLAVYADYRMKKYNTIHFGSASSDPLLAAADSFMTQRLVSHIVLMGRSDEELSTVDNRLPYIDIALL